MQHLAPDHRSCPFRFNTFALNGVNLAATQANSNFIAAPAQITIINRSKWPTPFLRILAEFVVAQMPFPFTSDYRIIVRSTQKVNSWRGVGRDNSQIIRLHRRFQPLEGWPMKFRDCRYRWSAKYELRSRIEALTFIMAHEAAHGDLAHPRNFRRENGQLNLALMEHYANQSGYAAVRYLRESWPQLRREITASLRSARKARRRNPRGYLQFQPHEKAATVPNER